MKKSILLLSLIYVLISSGCVAKKPDIAPRGEHWPEPVSQGAVYYQPRTMASLQMARKALADVTPLLSVPGRKDSTAFPHFATPTVLVLERAWTQHEFQRAEEPRWCWDLMWDCPTPPDKSVMVRKTDKSVVDLAELLDLRLFDDGRIQVAHSQGTAELAAADRNTQILFADALYTLASGRGYVQPARAAYRAAALTPDQADDLDLEGGVLVMDVAVDGPAWNAGLRHADVVLEIGGVPATPALLAQALSGTIPVPARVLRWHREGKLPRLVTRMLDLTLGPAADIYQNH